MTLFLTKNFLFQNKHFLLHTFFSQFLLFCHAYSNTTCRNFFGGTVPQRPLSLCPCLTLLFVFLCLLGLLNLAASLFVYELYLPVLLIILLTALKSACLTKRICIFEHLRAFSMGALYKLSD